MPAVDLSQLPEPAIIAEPDFEAILADTKAMMIAAYPAEQREAVSAALELESEPLTLSLKPCRFVKCCYASGSMRGHAPAC